MIRFRDTDDAAPVKAVFVLFNRAPYAIVARRSRGIHLLLRGVPLCRGGKPGLRRGEA